MGKQINPIRRPVHPAPMATRSMAPPPPPQMAEPEYVEEPIEAPPRQQAPRQVRVAPPRQVTDRIPPIEQFPPIAQRQIAAQQNRIEHIAEHAARKKKGLFERLASVGLNRKEDPLMPQREPTMRAAPPTRREAPQPPAPPPTEQAYDDDQLEIPAFLRRQAN